jgi:cell cycle checkpoint protein
MDSSLHDVWLAAKGSEFTPTIGKDNQFIIGFFLLLLGISITGAFALSTRRLRFVVVWLLELVVLTLT